MAATGETFIKYVGRQTPSGRPSLSKTSASDWVASVRGVVVTPGSITEIGTAGNWRWYSMILTMPTTVGDPAISIDPSNSDLIRQGQVGGDLQARDTDDLASLLFTTNGSVDPITFSDSDFGSVVEGDAWRPPGGTVEVAASLLTRFSLTDLSGMTISASLMDGVDGTEVPLTTATITDESARLVTFGWDTFPVALALPANSQDKTWYLDVQLKVTATGLILTAIRGTLTVLWERDTTT